MTECLVSIIIPVYNVEKYLEKCLKSVINQTYSNIEIICVNDGSTDNSLDILKKFSKKDKRIRIIDKKNDGVSSARNCGLEIFKGGVIAFLDSDDFVHEKYIEELLKMLNESKSDISVCNYTTDVEKFDNLTSEKTVFYDINTFRSNYFLKIHIWGRLYKASLLKQIRFPEKIKLGEDTIFNMEVICYNPNLKITYTNKKLYFYRNRADSIVHVIEHADIYKTGEYYLENIDKLTNELSRSIYIIESFKTFLAYRYLKMFDEDKEYVKSYCQNRMSNLLKKMKENKRISIKKRMIYTIFLQIPIAYRRYRILNDPTLLAWEKRKRRNCNNSYTEIKGDKFEK